MGLIAIGDIHGCAQTLDAMLERLDPSADDHLVFVGDYVDRGPDSRAVIERLLKLREEVRCTFLRGNHEALMLSYLNGENYALWQANGASSTLRSYTNGRRQVHIPDAHEQFVRNAERYYETDDFFFVHAGLKPQCSIRENLERFNDDEVLLWERDHLEAPHLAWEKPVVCGHTPQPTPINRDRLLAIDTGCVYNMHPNLGRLTAVHLPEREFVTVDYVG
jgi:serine/threonine protein phosphatase 1